SSLPDPISTPARFCADADVIEGIRTTQAVRFACSIPRHFRSRRKLIASACDQRHQPVTPVRDSWSDAVRIWIAANETPMALDLPVLSLRGVVVPPPRPIPSPPAAQPTQAALATRAVPALGQILLDRELITPEQLDVAVAHQRGTDRRLGQVLLELGFTTHDAVLGALSIQLGVPATRLNGFNVDAAAGQSLPEKIARKRVAVPMHRVGQTLQ